MPSSSPSPLAAVAGQQRKSRATAGRIAVLPFQLYDGSSGSTCRVDLLDIECDLDDAPPLIWDSDMSSDETPDYLEGWEEPLASGAKVFISEDDVDLCSVNMTPGSPLYQHRISDYESLSEPWFSSKIRPYPDELSTEENYFFQEFETCIFGRHSEVVPPSPVATFSIADSGADTFLITFERPLNVGLPVEEGSTSKSCKIHGDFYQRVIYLGDL